MKEKVHPSGGVTERPLVYLVDDAPCLAEMLEVFLGAAGYRTRAFKQPKKAIEALQTESVKPVLMVTDFQMPGMNGMELIQRCKSVHPGLKTISASGTLTPEMMKDYPVQPDRFLPKPYFPDQLLRVLRELID